MREIFEDTAMKTLQEQMAADKPMSMSSIRGNVNDGPGVDLSDLEGAGGHWASLAFAPAVSRK
jgi:hypothetical protein